MNPAAETNIARLKEDILTYPGVVDPPDAHHEFASGMHGRKCDLDEIPADDPLFAGLAEASAVRIEELYHSRLPDFIITIAGGGNRFADPLRQHFGSKVSVRETIKDPEDKKEVILNERTEKALQRTYPESVLLVDDLGTTGSVTARVGRKILDLHIPSLKEIRAFVPVQRRDELEYLDEIGVGHDSLIDISGDLPTYTKKECEAKYYCKDKVHLIPLSSYLFPEHRP